MIKERKNSKDYVRFRCSFCGDERVMDLSTWRQRLANFGIEPRYCSKPCSYGGRKAETAARHSLAKEARS